MLHLYLKIEIKDTQLPFDILFITMFDTCLVTEVMYHRGEQHHKRKKLKSLYILSKKCPDGHKKSRLLIFVMQIRP